MPYTMKTKALSIILSILICISCDFRKSVAQDLVTGMVTRGNGLSCESVTLTVDEKTVQSTRFTYGKTFHVNFNNMEGFVPVAGYVFPGMSLVVTGQNGDTVLSTQDLYAEYTEGMDLSPLVLISTVTVADPIHSNGTYTLMVNIWDKKGDGIFTADLDFSVVPNGQIRIESDQLSYKEIYLYSEQEGKVITDQKARFNENIYTLIEGLDGLAEENGSFSVGLGMKVADAEGNLIIDEEDLIGDSGYSYEQVHSQLSSHFILTGSQVMNPVDIEIVVWDKQGDGRLNISTRLTIE
jgi:hypothetical protein